MTHDYHEGLPGFHPDQVLHDGCAECESRGRDIRSALAHMDAMTFRRAWLRAADNHASHPPSGTEASHISGAETQVLEALWGVQVRLEGIWPLGFLPDGTQ